MTHMNRHLLAAAIAGLFASHTSAAFAQTVTLQQAYEAALSYDAAFSAAQATLVASKEKAVQAKASLLPTLNFNANASRSALEQAAPAPDRAYSTAGMTLAGSYPLFRPANNEVFNQAQASVRIAEAALLGAKQELITRTAQAYFDVLLAQDTLTSIAAQKAAISEQLAQSKREFEVGTKTIVDTNEAQARFDQVLALEAVAQGDVLIKKSALQSVTGLAPKAFARLGDKPKIAPALPSNPDTWASRALEAAIPVQTAEISRDIAKFEVSRAKSANAPTLDLTASLNATRNMGSASSNNKTTTHLASLGLAFNYPIYSGGALDSRTREAAALLEKSQFDLESARRTAAQSARQAYYGLNYGVAQITALESAERSSLTLLDSTKLGYQVGVRINLDVLNAQQALASTRKDLTKARYDALLAGLRLKSATTQLTEADVASLSAQLTGAPVNH